jgi:hypothetical protein
LGDNSPNCNIHFHYGKDGAVRSKSSLAMLIIAAESRSAQLRKFLWGNHHITLDGIGLREVRADDGNPISLENIGPREENWLAV